MRHVQHDNHDDALTTTTVYQNADTPPRSFLLPGQGSPTPAVSVAHYGVIEVSSPSSDVPGADSSDANETDSGSVADGNSIPRWYNGPWGALLCDIICFKDDFARKAEAVFWDSINAEKQKGFM